MIRHFRYLLEALLVYSLFGFSWLLPISAASYLGGWLARTIGPHVFAHKTALTNIQTHLPQLNTKQQQAILTNMWDNLGRTVMEFPHFATMKKEKFLSYVTIHNSQHITDSCQQKRPIVFVSAHLANWEILAQASALLGHPIAGIYRKANNPYVEHLITGLRRRFQYDAIDKSRAGAKKIVSHMRENRLIGMLADQKFDGGIAAPFFGTDAMTSTVPADMALKYNALLIPIQIVRRARSPYFDVYTHLALDFSKEDKSAKSVYDITTLINRHIEQWVREHPDQWFWVHKRWPKN